MVVTSSRLAAVRYMKEFKRYISEKGYTDMNALVAFSGDVTDDGEEYTEPKMNGIKENQLKETFTTPDYNVLIVAEKYQTGFDKSSCIQCSLTKIFVVLRRCKLYQD